MQQYFRFYRKHEMIYIFLGEKLARCVLDDEKSGSDYGMEADFQDILKR